jgi:hypothetical protein
LLLRFQISKKKEKRKTNFQTLYSLIILDFLHFIFHWRPLFNKNFKYRIIFEELLSDKKFLTCKALNIFFIKGRKFKVLIHNN